MAWIMTSDGPFNTNFITPADKPFVGDSPLYFFKINQNINNGFPYNDLMLSSWSLLGAFANMPNLRKVTIPKTVKSIGPTAFRNTKLTSVTIARDCVYQADSFPEGCIVNFYPTT